RDAARRVQELGLRQGPVRLRLRRLHPGQARHEQYRGLSPEGGVKDSRVERALARTRRVPFWLDQPDAPQPANALSGKINAELAVIGGGFTGLWAALLAKEVDPDTDVVLVEGRRIAWAGTGRNGGFCSASLTHGVPNVLERFPDELATLDRLGRRNLDEIEKTVARYDIDC